MKYVDKQTGKKVDNDNISSRIREIAVEHGLKLPQTQEEVALFEKKFASEIQSANLNPPPLEYVLSLAKRITASDESVVTHQVSEPVDQRYAMAARSGREITSEIEDRMEEAIRKVKLEKKVDE